jgi:HNH endonuclease
MSELDEDIRASCVGHLEILWAEFGDDIPYVGGLNCGFAFRGRRIPFLNYQKGIYRSSVQRGPAALSINTTIPTIAHSARRTDSKSLSFTSSARDRAGLPATITQLGLRSSRPGLWLARSTNRSPFLWMIRAICRLKEGRLLDAAHIIGDLQVAGDAVVTNGLSLCSIHHRAFDQHLVGISPEYKVHVSRRLLNDEDGPMLDLLKGFHEADLQVPSRRAWRPDRERLAERFDRFVDAAA